MGSQRTRTPETKLVIKYVAGEKKNARKHAMLKKTRTRAQTTLVQKFRILLENTASTLDGVQVVDVQLEPAGM